MIVNRHIARVGRPHFRLTLAEMREMVRDTQGWPDDTPVYFKTSGGDFFEAVGAESTMEVPVNG